MTADDIVSILIPTTFAAFLVLERVVPARPLPRIRGWLVKGILFFLGAGALNAVVPALIIAGAGPHTLLHLASLGTLGGAIAMLLVGDLLTYWVHRGMHNSRVVWRWTHQLHHSAERMDMAGAAYFHPFDFLLQNAIPGGLVVVLLGVTPTAAALGGFLGFFFGVAPHLNVRTPVWLGYVFQRPEMHALHHQRGVHSYNYGNFAISDLLFGTWRNPASFPSSAYGFWDGASARLGAMLLGRDVAEPPAASPVNSPRP